MANISTYLANILSAVYGRDVRQSIHDAIDAINDDATSAVSTASSVASDLAAEVTAREDADTAIATSLESATEDIESAESAITAIKDNILSGGALDVISYLRPFSSRTHNGITFTWNDDCTECTASGTASAISFVNMYYSVTALPYGIVPGNTYTAKVSISGTQSQSNSAYFSIVTFTNGATTVGVTNYIFGEKTVTIPGDCTGLIIRVNVKSGATVNVTYSNFGLFSALTNTELEAAVNDAKDDATLKMSAVSYGAGAEMTVIENAYFDADGTIVTTSTYDVWAFKIYSDRLLKHIIVGADTGTVRFAYFSDTPVLGSASVDGMTHTGATGNTDVVNQSPASGAGWVGVRVLKGDYAKVYPIYTSIPQDSGFLGLNEYSYTTSTSNGITYTWSDDRSCIKLTGTSTGTSIYNIWHNYSLLPAGVNSGDKFFVQFRSANIHIIARVLFYDSERNVLSNVSVSTSKAITVPDDAVGMTLRLTVYAGYTLDDSVYIPLMYSYQLRSAVTSVKGNRPKYISFVDDDTTSDTYVSRYYNACMHNGVRGNFAVITGRYADGTNNIELLKNAIHHGFCTPLHCETQQTYLYPGTEDFDEVRAVENYLNAIDSYRDLGLINPQNIWIIPYGSTNEANLRIGKNLGFEMAFSTAGDTYNTFYDSDRYRMHRTGLSSYGDVTDDTDATEAGTMARCKARVDELAADDDGGWLVITTHFNEWDDMEYDGTLDSNGYEIGYSRFNSFVQYAISAGLTPITLADGAALFKPILDRNSTMG